MVNYKEDNNQSFRTILFMVLFLLLVLVSSNNQGNLKSSSAGFTRQHELVSGVHSSHHDPIIVNTVSLSDLQKHCELALRNTGDYPFSFRYITSDYNLKTAQTFILVRNNSLTIVPGLSLKLYLRFHSNKDDNLPVLS